tara:strand:+ start:202 stop:846 length:645 start_codon:yes stop_codon:yes gene_type:complete
MKLKIPLIVLILSLSFSCSIVSKKISKGQSANFNEEEKSMILKSDANQAMRVFKINNYHDSILLRKKADSLDLNSEKEIIKHFSSRLLATVRDTNSLGVGIAAPQVGILKRMIWVQRFDKKNLPFELYINPRIKQFSKKKQACREGCLSIPERSDTTFTRAYAILIEYQKIDGSKHYEMVEGFTAVIFQHEIDHLDGILYLDHLAEESRRARKP